jgi:hypothetical protein
LQHGHGIIDAAHRKFQARKYALFISQTHSFKGCRQVTGGAGIQPWSCHIVPCFMKFC